MHREKQLDRYNNVVGYSFQNLIMRVNCELVGYSFQNAMSIFLSLYELNGVRSLSDVNNL